MQFHWVVFGIVLSSMYITYHGYTCFKIQSARKVTIITDVFDKSIGLKPPSPRAEILTFSCNHYDAGVVTKGIKGNLPFIAGNPGEYEISGIIITGIPAEHGKDLAKESFGTTIYKFSIDGLVVCHLGDIGQKELSENQLDILGDIDILIIPVGGVYVLDSKEAARVVNQIEPRVIIPMAYSIPGLKLKLDKVNLFFQEIGMPPKEKLKKLKISKKDLPPEGMSIVEFRI